MWLLHKQTEKTTLKVFYKTINELSYVLFNHIKTAILEKIKCQKSTFCCTLYLIFKFVILNKSLKL